LKLHGLVAGVVLALTPSLAFADPDVGSVRTLPVIVVYGRAPKPSVVIELTRPTAAHEAGVAHEVLRTRLVEASAPPALRAAEK
jgi:hypothetical protein